nr:oncoprotein-induced transcript 3 protein-like [Pocillopora verrucosa]
MATYCIPKGSCNSRAVGWIDGNHPSEAYQLVSATVCFHRNSNCCAWSRPVQIRNCSGYYIYKLKTTACLNRYCGVNDESEACQVTGGSSKCPCQDGYEGDPCRDIDECSTNTHNCNSNANCTNTDGSFKCVCKEGYTGDGNSCSGKTHEFNRWINWEKYSK